MTERELPSLRTLTHRRGAPFSVGILAFLVAALVFFTEVSLSAAPIASVSLELAVTMFCLAVMYSSMADAGAEAGEEKEEVKAANAEWKSLAARVRSSGLASGLSGFCRRLAESERKEARCDLLASVGLSVEDGLALSLDRARLRTLERPIRRAVRRAALLPLLRLSPDLLLYGSGEGRRRMLLPPTAAATRHRATARAMLPAMLGSLLTVSVAIGCRDGIDASTAISAALRLLALLSSGVKGYLMGYRSVTEEGVRCAYVRAEYLSRFLSENK
jgi:hypothetical protein